MSPAGGRNASQTILLTSRCRPIKHCWQTNYNIAGLSVLPVQTITAGMCIIAARRTTEKVVRYRTASPAGREVKKSETLRFRVGVVARDGERLNGARKHARCVVRDSYHRVGNGRR